MNYRKHIIAAAIVACISLANVRGQTVGTGDLGADFSAIGTDFMTGEISNILVVTGANYLEASHQTGGELYLGYNIPSLKSLPLQPRIIPFVGIAFMGKSFEGVSGTCTLKADLHPLRFFDGPTKTGFTHDFTITPYGVAGVVQNISGETFGSFKVPGVVAKNGQGTGAETGYGAEMSIFRTKTVAVGLWFQRETITTIAGTIDEGGVCLRYSPKGW